MKVTITGALMVLLMSVISWSGPLEAQDIYKTVDENGNPVYTDRPPTPDSKPLSLRELSIVEVPVYAGRSTDQQAGQQAAQDDGAPPTMNEMRATYRNFRLVSPAPEQNIWGTGNTATIAWDAGTSLGEGMSVIFYIDGQAVTDPTQNSTYTSGRLDRGEHTAKADLVDGGNRVIASTEPVTFFIMQQSRGGG